MSSEISARRSQTRDRLCDAAVSVFARQGVGAASVEELCEAAGFTRGAFYSNFASKDELCLALLDRQCELQLAAVRHTIATLEISAAAGSEAIVDALPRAVDVYLASQRASREWILADAEMRLYAARDASLRESYREFDKTMAQVFGTLIEDAAARFGHELTLPAIQVTNVVHAVYSDQCIRSLIDDAPESHAETRELLTSVLLGFVRPARGAGDPVPGEPERG